MKNGSTSDRPPGAAESLASIEAADEYLSGHPYPGFIDELRAAWHEWERNPIRRPPSRGEVQRYIKHMNAALVAAGARPSDALWRTAESRGRWLKGQLAPDSVAPFWRRVADEPKQFQLALILASAAFTCARDAASRDRHLCALTGGIAATLAVALGVDRPPRRGEDPKRTRIRTWEKRVASARGYVASLRADEIA
jgi:hypothetical protein